MQCYHPPRSGVKDDGRGGVRRWGDRPDAATAAEAETAHSLLRIAKGGAPASSNFETQPPPLAWATRPLVLNAGCYETMNGISKHYRVVLYAAATIVLVSGIAANRNYPLGLPLSGFISFCLAVKAGSKREPTLPAVMVGVLISLLTVAANIVPTPAVRETLATAAVIGTGLLVFLRGRTLEDRPTNPPEIDSP